MDTPFYNYSDELDEEIVNNCKDGYTCVVVLNAVGATGYQDKNFLKGISDNNVIKLIFIFNCMDQITKDNYHRTKDQHERNATRISNEILIPSQENIPIFFVENCQMNEDELLSLLAIDIDTEIDINTLKKKLKHSNEIMETLKKKENEFKDYETKRRNGNADFSENLKDINEKFTEFYGYLNAIISVFNERLNEISQGTQCKEINSSAQPNNSQIEETVENKSEPSTHYIEVNPETDEKVNPEIDEKVNPEIDEKVNPEIDEIEVNPENYEIEVNPENYEKNVQIEILKDLIIQIRYFENTFTIDCGNQKSRKASLIEFCEDLIENKSKFGKILNEKSDSFKDLEIKTIVEEKQLFDRNLIDETIQDYILIPNKEIKKEQEKISNEKKQIEDALKKNRTNLNYNKEKTKNTEEENQRNEKKKGDDLISRIRNFENAFKNYCLNQQIQNACLLELCEDLIENKSKFRNIKNEKSDSFKLKEIKTIVEQKVNNELPENDLKELLKTLSKQIGARQVIGDKLIDSFLQFVGNYNTSLNQKPNSIANMPINNWHSKMNTDQESHDVENIIHRIKCIKENSEDIGKILNDIEVIYKEFSKNSSNCSSALTNLLEYIRNMLKYLNDIWKNDMSKISLRKISTFLVIPDKLITEIDFVEIESFHVLLIFLLLIKILLEIIIAEKNKKYSPGWNIFNKYSPGWNIFNKYSPGWNIFNKDYHKENMNKLNNALINMKFFDKFDQIKFIKYEIIREYSNSENNQLETRISKNQNKLDVLNDIEENNEFD